MAGSLRAARHDIFCKRRKRQPSARRCSAVPDIVALFQMMLLAEPFAYPVHPAPQQDCKHKVDRVLQGDDQ